MQNDYQQMQRQQKHDRARSDFGELVGERLTFLIFQTPLKTTKLIYFQTAEIVNSYYRAVKCTQEEYDAIRQRAGEVSVVVATPAVFHVERRVQENRAVDDQQPGPSNSQSTSQRTATVAKMPSRSSTTDFKPGDIML